MTKEEVREGIKKAMRDNWIFSKDDAEKAIDFVRELLEISIDETRENEPHATTSIKEMQESVSRVSDLLDMINDNDIE